MNSLCEFIKQWEDLDNHEIKALLSELNSDHEFKQTIVNYFASLPKERRARIVSLMSADEVFSLIVILEETSQCYLVLETGDVLHGFNLLARAIQENKLTIACYLLHYDYPMNRACKSSFTAALNSLTNEEFSAVLSKVNYFTVYRIFFKVTPVTHDLKQLISLNQEKATIVHHFANFYILHCLFAYKNKDTYHQDAALTFITIIQALKSVDLSHNNYVSTINTIIDGLPSSFHWIGIVPVGKHPLRKHLELLATIPEDILVKIVPAYLRFLETNTFDPKLVEWQAQINTSLTQPAATASTPKKSR